MSRKVMPAALVAGCALALLSHPWKAGAKSTPATCGTERWAVKTLADPAARTINFHPRSVTISYLRSLPRTTSYTRGPGVERTTYRIKARLVKTKIEDDEDIHLVLADPQHRARTMIVEFPSPNCTHHSIKRKEMRQARTAFITACGVPPSGSFRNLRGSAVITGVGFFDYDHGQTGVAPNAIELHPVLSFTHARCR